MIGPRAPFAVAWLFTFVVTFTVSTKTHAAEVIVPRSNFTQLVGHIPVMRREHHGSHVVGLTRPELEHLTRRGALVIQNYLPQALHEQLVQGAKFYQHVAQSLDLPHVGGRKVIGFNSGLRAAPEALKEAPALLVVAAADMIMRDLAFAVRADVAAHFSDLSKQPHAFDPKLVAGLASLAHSTEPEIVGVLSGTQVGHLLLHVEHTPYGEQLAGLTPQQAFDLKLKVHRRILTMSLNIDGPEPQLDAGDRLSILLPSKGPWSKAADGEPIPREQRLVDVGGVEERNSVVFFINLFHEATEGTLPQRTTRGVVWHSTTPEHAPQKPPRPLAVEAN